MSTLSPYRRLTCASCRLVLVAFLCALAACSRGKDASHIGTFQMGERVQAGPLIYNVLEAEWKPQLESSGRAPKERFLFIKVSMTNSSGSSVSAPAFTLESSTGKTYEEVTEGLDGVTDWLGMLRTIAPAQTEQGWAIFDAPMAAYKLVLSDAGEIGNEKYARVDIPVHLE
jgi:hypothetical protein